ALQREAAMFTLQRWVSRSNKQGKILYDPKSKEGPLVEKKFKPSEASAIYKLLHPFLADELGKVETYELLVPYLKHRKVAIAELASGHLVWLPPDDERPTVYNAAAPIEDREKFAAQVQELIDKKQLPPMRAPAKEKEKEKEKVDEPDKPLLMSLEDVRHDA